MEQEDEVDRDIHGGLESLYDRVNQLWCKDWIMGHLPTERATRKTGHGDLDPDREFQQLQRQRVPPVIPRPLRTRAHIFLHLFSGHRREGDVQACVETYSYTLGGAVRALSVDLVISASWGDLSHPSTQRLFMQAIMEGWISGLASGPPCETWSKAREVRLDDTDWGPRPIRNAQELWGMEHLTIREMRQLLMGNSLLGIAVLFFMAAWLSGTFAMLEHPVEPGASVSASIWKLEVLRYAAALPQVQKITVYQGFFGASSPKPTTLLFAHAVPDVDEIFRQHQIRKLCPTTSSIGRNAHGRFKTEALKAYPPALCGAIAAAWYVSVRQRPSTTEDNVGAMPEQLQAAVDALHCAKIGESKMGPDYHGANVQTHRHGQRPA